MNKIITIFSYLQVNRKFTSFINGFFALKNGNQRGPGQRFQNLIIGLKRKGYPFRANPPKTEISENVHVLADPSALEWAIEAKRRGIIKRLIIGPNICAHPNEYGGLIKDKNIDFIINASTWVSRMFVYFAPGLKNRIREWFAGVDTDIWKPDIKTKKRFEYLVYDKAYEEMWNGWISEKHNGIFNKIIEYLKKEKYNFTVLRYKKYKPKEYLNKLRETKAMIYLSRQETQGQALQEAWALDVPVLIWDRQTWSYKEYYYEPASSAPYLDKSAGYYFRDFEEFLSVFPEFSQAVKNRIFTPRKYVLANLTIDMSTKKYLDVWSELLLK